MLVQLAIAFEKKNMNKVAFSNFTSLCVLSSLLLNVGQDRSSVSLVCRGLTFLDVNVKTSNTPISF